MVFWQTLVRIGACTKVLLGSEKLGGPTQWRSVMLNKAYGTHELIYDWNLVEKRPKPSHRILITDETLRDGLQSPSILHPDIQDKVYLLYLMNDLGVDAADLGLCGAGDRFKYHVTVLAREIATQHMPIQPQSAARTDRKSVV